jgi:hypothetical protein
MTYHVQGCMTFRSNKLDLAQFIENEAISDTHVALGVARN